MKKINLKICLLIIGATLSSFSYGKTVGKIINGVPLPSVPRQYAIFNHRMHAKNVQPPKPLPHRGTQTNDPSSAPPTTGSGLSASQVLGAYGISQLSQTGAGQTIAIIDAYGGPNVRSDLNAYSAALGLPAPQLQIVYPFGQLTTTNESWAVESTLDVEFVHSVAPGAKILLVVTPDNSGVLDSSIEWLSNNASLYGVSVVSMSWCGTEWANETYYDQFFSRSGVTWIAASGDWGAQANFPATSPFVLSVGGTKLTTSGNNYSSEVGWSGSGGSYSVYEARPAYQNNWVSSRARAIPDVSYVGSPDSPEQCYIDGAWDYCWGTSIGTPQWAGVVALANSGRTSNLSGVNSALYQMATGSTTTTNSGILGVGSSTTTTPNQQIYFYDIKSGCNGTASNQCAVAGYDTVTGLGSLKANVVVPKLINPSANPSSPPSSNGFLGLGF